jgi:hypothetical protein
MTGAPQQDQFTQAGDDGAATRRHASRRGAEHTDAQYREALAACNAPGCPMTGIRATGYVGMTVRTSFRPERHNVFFFAVPRVAVRARGRSTEPLRLTQ